MAKNFNPRTAESLFKQKLRTMIGSTAHTQNIAYRVIENVSCVCEEAMQVLVEELQKGTRLHEILTGD